MSDVALAIPKQEPGTAFRVKAEQYAANALTIMEIKTPEHYREVAELFKSGAAAKKEVEAFFKTLKDPAYASWKNICEKETGIVSQLERGRKHLSGKMVVFEQEQEKKRREQEAEIERQRRIQEEQVRQEAIRKAEEERLEQARTLEVAGKQEEAMELLDAPIAIEEDLWAVPVAPIVVPKETPAVKGLIVKKTWKARLKGRHPYPAPVSEDEQQKSFMELVKAVAAGQVPITVLELNQKALNDFAKGMKKLMTWPGVETFEESSHAGRG